MQLPDLTAGRILRRYKRFLADVLLDNGDQVVAHCPNTGTMRTCWQPQAPVQLSYNDNSKRKLVWTLERVDMGAGWIGVHTGRVNAVIAEGITAGTITALSGYSLVRREVVVNLPNLASGRLDLGLTSGSAPDALVEIKNVTLLDGHCLRFPDAVTLRGYKHLNILQAIHQQGLRAVLVFALNRPEGDFFAPASSIDPNYAQKLREVASMGVEILAVRIHHGQQELTVGESVVVHLDY